jgi:hypothetical protein
VNGGQRPFPPPPPGMGNDDGMKPTVIIEDKNLIFRKPIFNILI